MSLLQHCQNNYHYYPLYYSLLCNCSIRRQQIQKMLLRQHLMPDRPFYIYQSYPITHDKNFWSSCIIRIFDNYTSIFWSLLTPDILVPVVEFSLKFVEILSSSCRNFKDAQVSKAKVNTILSDKNSWPQKVS